MMTPDMINGLFELVGALLIFMSIRQLLKDKMVAGVHWAPIAFFTAWGAWNLIFYPSLGQWYSFYAALVMVIANGIWLGLMIHYWKK